MTQLLFALAGRAPRRTYWVVNLTATAVAAFLAYVVAGFVHPGLPWLDRMETTGFGIPFWLLIIAATLGTTARRAHDRNLTDLWVLPFLVVPGVLDLLSTAVAPDGSTVEHLLAAATITLSVWGVVELGVRRGTVGPNRYGPDPLGG